MRPIGLLLATMALGCWAAVAQAEEGPAGARPAKPLKKALKDAPRLRALPDKAKKDALRGQAQHLHAQWAKAAVESAERTAAATARMDEQIEALQKQATVLKEEVARLQQALRAARAASPQRPEPEPKAKPKPAAQAPAKPEKLAKPTPTPKAQKPEDAGKKEREALAKSIKKEGDVKPPKGPTDWVAVAIDKHFNNDGISTAKNRRDSNFDEFRQAYVAELLPEPGSVHPLKHIPQLPFIFPAKKDGVKNNVAASGQRIEVPPARYSKLYVMGAGVFGGQMGDLTLVYAKGEKATPLKLSDWCGASKFGEAQAYAMGRRHNWRGQDEPAVCSLWVQAVAVSPEQPLQAIVLPKRPKMHIFAITLAKPR